MKNIRKKRTTEYTEKKKNIQSIQWIIKSVSSVKSVVPIMVAAKPDCDEFGFFLSDLSIFFIERSDIQDWLLF